MSFVVQSLILLVMATGYAVQAQNVTQGFDFQLFMVKFGNLEQMIGQLQTDIRKQEESLEGLTSRFQQLQTEIRQQGETLDSHNMLLSTISEESTSNAQQLQTEIRKHAEMTQYYYRNLLDLLTNGGDSCKDENITQPGHCQMKIGDKTLDLVCEEDLHGGGWIVIQNRFDGSADFFRNWTEYRKGFGKLDGEFWLGLENIHLLTSSKDYELLVHLETHDGYTGFSRYSKFMIGGENDAYRLSTLGSYSGTAGDALSYHRFQRFSTYDRDNDVWQPGSCAADFHGAWWFASCANSHLNGVWEKQNLDSMFWGTFRDKLKVTKMMIRET